MQTIKKVAVNALFIKTWADTKGYKQSELARALGISTRTYRRYSKIGVFPWAVFKLLQAIIGESGTNTHGMTPTPYTTTSPHGVNR